MSYTGYQAVTAGSATLNQVEAILDAADHIQTVTGTAVKHRAFTKLRKAADQLEAVRAEYRKITETTSAALEAVAARYAAGEATALDVVLQAASTATTNAAAVEVQRLSEAAIADLNRAAVAEARVIGDAWLVPLKARVSALLTEAQSVANRIDHQPTPATPGIRRHDNLWAPTRSDLESNMGLRHDWERLGAILDDLDDTHALADDLRRAGLVPTAPGRDYAEDYRWRLAHRLEGRPDEVREFFLANRAVAEPGLFTAAELADCPPPNARQQGVDSFTRAALEAV